jgi:methanogen homocitrate synthase
MDTWKSTDWWASPYNDLPAFRDGTKLPRTVEIHDATLRDGEQTPGVVFSPDDKVEIARMLDSLGVERIEAGMPAVSADDREAIKRICALGLKARIFSFARAMDEDIDMAKACGAHGVVIEIPTSEPKLKYQFPKWTEEDVIRRSIATVSYAKKQGLEALYFGYDTTRANYAFIKRLYGRLIEEARPDSIGIVDTMGCILPGAVRELIRDLKAEFDVRLEIHTHNDFGMATAVSFAAMEAGAEVIHTSINGLGERTGNTALEEIIAGLQVLYGIGRQYHPERLRQVSQRVARMAGFPVQVNKPVVGDNIFVRESGIGIDLVMERPLAMFAMDPRMVGHQSGVVLGKKSGAMSVVVKARQLGYELADAAADPVLQDVKRLGIQKKGLVTDQEFLEILERHGHAHDSK